MKIFLLTFIMLLCNLKGAIAANLVPYNSIGAAKYNKTVELSTGTGARSSNQLSVWLNVPLGIYGTEGTIATFANLDPLEKYVFEWQIETTETNRDVFMTWDGKTFNQIATGATATLSIAYTNKRISPWLTTSIANTRQIALIAMDTTDKLNTTVVRVRKFHKVPEPGVILGLAMVGGIAMRRKISR